jgi:hypothetical protein
VAHEAIQNLEELLRALGAERNLRGRLRVVGRAWELLKQLSPVEREKVALRLGSSWAWKRLEKSFLADGTLSESESMIGRIFDRMGDADPNELRELAKTVRSGDKARMKDLLLMTLEEALEEEAEDEEAQRTEAEPALDTEETDLDVEELPLEQAPPAEAHEPEVVESVEGVLASTLAEAVDAREPEPAPAIVPPSPPPSAPDDAGWRSPPPLPPALDLEGPEPEPFSAMPATLEGGVGGLGRLHLLRALDRQEQPGAGMSRAERIGLIESLGGGWASRRALSCLIRRGGVPDLDEALELVGRLGRPMQQAWCLGDLLERDDLTPADVDRILAAAPTAAVRRRLQHRASP